MRIRPAEAADADQLVELAEAVGTEDGDWLISTSAWRSVAEERRYLKAIRGHPDAAVFVSDDGGHIVGTSRSRATRTPRRTTSPISG